jgi:hypothetical protein
MTQPPVPPNTPPDPEDLLVEQVATAYRPLHPTRIQTHPVWHDLSEQGRVRAFELAAAMRKVEAALDPQGLSSTARAVLARLR